MKKIIKTLTITGIASSMALASNFFITNQKQVENKKNISIDTSLNNDINASNSEDFKLSLSNTGENVSLDIFENDETSPTTNTSNLDNETNQANISTLEENNEDITTLEETKKDISIDESLNAENPATYPMVNPKTQEDSEQENNTNLNINQEETELVDENNNLNDLEDNNKSIEDNSETNNNQLDIETDDNNELEDETNITLEQDNYDIQNELEILEEINQDLTESINQTNDLLSNLNFDNLLEEDKQSILEHVEFLNQKSNELVKISNSLKCELTGNCSLNSETIESLTYRLDNLQNLIQSMQMLNNQIATNYDIFSNPYANIYGYSFTMYPKTDDNQNNNNENLEDNSTENTEEVNTSTEKTASKKNIDSYKKTFLSNNLDSYGPKRRNIDTFFNTAFLDEYGYMPYYNNFNHNFNYNGINSNNANLKNNTNNAIVSDENTVSTQNPLPPEKTNPNRVKFAKNIDSYSSKTMNTNINTMNGKKITDIIKTKFNKWFKKDKSAKKEIDNYVDNFIEKNSNKLDKLDNKNLVEEQNLNNKKLQDIVSSDAIPHKTKDIKEEDLSNNYKTNNNSIIRKDTLTR